MKWVLIDIFYIGPFQILIKFYRIVVINAHTEIKSVIVFQPVWNKIAEYGTLYLSLKLQKKDSLFKIKKKNHRSHVNKSVPWYKS